MCEFFLYRSVGVSNMDMITQVIGLIILSVGLCFLFLYVSKSEKYDENEKYVEDKMNQIITKITDSFDIKLLSVKFCLDIVIACMLLLFYQNTFLDSLNTMVLVNALFAITLYDLKYHIIPNRALITLLGIKVIVVLLTIFTAKEISALFLLIDMLIAGLAFLLIGVVCRFMNKNAIGMGDVKLLSVIGIVLGVNDSFHMVITGMVCIFFVSVIGLFLKKLTRDSELPLAPFIFAGLIISAISMGV